MERERKRDEEDGKNRGEERRGNHTRAVEKFRRYNTCLTGKPEREEREDKEILEILLTENFPKLITDIKSIYLGSLGNTDQDKYHKNLYLGYHFQTIKNQN